MSHVISQFLDSALEITFVLDLVALGVYFLTRGSRDGGWGGGGRGSGPKRPTLPSSRCPAKGFPRPRWTAFPHRPGEIRMAAYRRGLYPERRRKEPWTLLY